MKYKDSNGNIKELILRGNFNNVLTKDNSISYTPSGDYNPATKKYVDDATFIYVFNIQDDTPEIKQKNLDIINKYFADTNTNKRLMADTDGLKMDFDMIFTEGSFWGLSYSYLSPVGSGNGGSIFFGMIESEDGTSYTHSKKISQLVGALDVLMKANTEAFTPTLDYHPATKKYVDDSITTMYRFKYRFSETAEQKQENIDIIKSYLNNVSNNKKFIFDVISSNGSVNYSIEAGIVTSNVASKTLNASGTLMFYDQMGYVGVLSTNLTYSNETYTVGGFESMLVTGNQLEKLLEDKLYPMDITNNTLTLNRNKYQSASITNDTTIILPTTTEFTEIHLYFSTTTDLTITIPVGVKWQTQPSFLANKTYEIIFTYIDPTIGWLGNVIQYN